MKAFELIMAWATEHPFLSTAIVLGGLGTAGVVGWKAMDSAKEFGKNGTPLWAFNLPDNEAVAAEISAGGIDENIECIR